MSFLDYDDESDYEGGPIDSYPPELDYPDEYADWRDYGDEDE